VTVEIVLAVYNGARYLPALLDSIQAQTHSDWRLWVRDDGSSDDSVAIIRARAAADGRVAVLHSGGPPGGATRAFAWLLDRLPGDAGYVMCADQDDVWLPYKVERTLRAMLDAEAGQTRRPVLVHTDLAVVDERLEPIHRSFWEFSQLPPEPVTLRRYVVRNSVTGAALMVNRALVDLACPIPRDAMFHDWWLALVGAAFGRVVAVREPTILYRQHGKNAVGAYDRRITLRAVARSIATHREGTRWFREKLAETARQAAAFLDRYGPALSEADRVFLREFAALPEQPLLRRKRGLLRLRTLPDQGLLRNAVILLRG
jgi:glycosyltransferase involved in cell wall biosynthesis